MVGPAGAPLLGRHDLYKAAQRKVFTSLANAAHQQQSLLDGQGSSLKSAQLVKLAERIRDAGTRVPIHISSLLQDVIEGRESCAAWYQQQPVSRSEDNKSHRWFINILKEVRRTLVSSNAKDRSSEASKPDHDSLPNSNRIQDHLSNLFTHLELEEPSQAPLGAAQRHQPKQSSAPSIDEMDISDCDPSVDFDLWCLLQDLNDVREFVRQAWSEYASGAISIVAASTITETAIGLIRLKNEEFSPQHTNFKDWWYLLRHFSIEAHATGNTTYIHPSNGGALRWESSGPHPAYLSRCSVSSQGCSTRNAFTR